MPRSSRPLRFARPFPSRTANKFRLALLSRAAAGLLAAWALAAYAELDARPYAEQLVEARCTRCHSPKNYFREDHTWLGWQWVVLRMQWLNDAELKAAERAAIVAYLSTARPAPPTGVMLEWGAPLATGLVFALLFIWRWRSKQRGKRF